ncbi:MAG: UPF0149 family protein [Pseudomonadota bacterium]
MPESTLSYAACEAAMQRCQFAFVPAEAQGIAVGLLASGQSDPAAMWQAELYADLAADDLLAQECRALLDAVYATTSQQIGDPGITLQLFLPEAAPELMVAALRDWAQGFLFGFGLAGAVEASLSDDGRELLQHVYEVAQLDTSRIAQDESVQEGLMQIEEFLRVAALSLYTERQAATC